MIVVSGGMPVLSELGVIAFGRDAGRPEALAVGAVRCVVVPVGGESTTIVVGSQFVVSVPERVAVASMLVTPLAVAMLVMLGTLIDDRDDSDDVVVGGGGSCVTVSSGMVVLPLLVPFGEMVLIVGNNVGSVVGVAVTSEMVVPETVAGGVESDWGGSVAVVFPLTGGAVDWRPVFVGSDVVLGGSAVSAGPTDAVIRVGILVSVPFVMGSGMTAVG